MEPIGEEKPHEIAIFGDRTAVLGPAGQGSALPALFAVSPQSARRFWEFFTAEIPNDNTRKAYFCAVSRFAGWCDDRHLELRSLQPILIAAYIKELQSVLSVPSVKQHLAAVRMLFDYLVLGQIIPMNPAASVRGPKYVVTKGKTPVLTADEARHLIDSIETGTLKGLRDRALIATMAYTFARVGAVIGMKGEDYFRQGKRWWFRLHEKGGKRHEVPAHHKAEAHVDAWVERAGIEEWPKLPLFRTFGRDGMVTVHPLHENDVLRMIKKRAAAADLPTTIGCHTFRATGITAYLENGGTIEKAQQIAAHASPRTTKLYDRTSDTVTLEEIERIAI
jgi:site-specific recombinase XerD